MRLTWYINIALSVLLQSVLFWRAFRCRLWQHYPFFYAYLTYTTLWTLSFSLPVVIRQPQYAKAFWLSHLLAATLRFGIAADIYRHVFPKNSPLRGRAGFVVLSALTLLALMFWLLGAGPASTLVDAARKIALSVASWILIVLGLAHYYGIRIGRNVWGMAIGLLTFTGSELVYLAAMDLFPRLWPVCRSVHPIAFVFMMMVWTYALWGYYPNPRPPLLDRDLGRELLSMWQDRWAQIPDILRSVMKR